MKLRTILMRDLTGPVLFHPAYDKFKFRYFISTNYPSKLPKVRPIVPETIYSLLNFAFVSKYGSSPQKIFIL